MARRNPSNDGFLTLTNHDIFVKLETMDEKHNDKFDAIIKRLDYTNGKVAEAIKEIERQKQGILDNKNQLTQQQIRIDSHDKKFYIFTGVMLVFGFLSPYIFPKILSIFGF